MLMAPFAQCLPGIHATMFERARLRGGQLTTTLKKEPSMVASMINLQGGAPDTQLHETLILKNKSYHLKLTGIWKMRHHTPSSPLPRTGKTEEKWDGETERDVVRRTGSEDEELCQGLKIHFEVGFREMVSGSVRRVKPCRPGAQAAILAVTPLVQREGGGGLLYKVHQSAGTHHFLFPTVALTQLLFFFHRVYLWSEIYCCVDEQCKHPHNLELKSLLPGVIFTIRMMILRRELAIKASDGVWCPPPLRWRAPLPSFRFLWIFLESRGSTLDSVIFNKQGNANNHCDIFRSLPSIPLWLSHSHACTAHSPLYRASNAGKSRRAMKGVQCWSSR